MAFGRSTLGRLRRRAEAFLHPMRQRAAQARARDGMRPGRVLFVCQGNVCRSPFAEVQFRRDIARANPLPFETTSAGFIGPDRSPPSEALAAAARRGLDLTSHRSKLLTRDLVFGATLVVVMSAQQERALCRQFGGRVPRILVLGDLDPLPIHARTIRDPWNCSAEVFDDCYDRIDRCIRALVGLLSTKA